MGDRLHQHLDNISAGDLCEPLEQLVIPAIREHWSWSPLTNAPLITSKSWLASLSGGRTPIDSSVMIVFTALLSSPPKCIAMASRAHPLVFLTRPEFRKSNCIPSIRDRTGTAGLQCCGKAVPANEHRSDQITCHCGSWRELFFSCWEIQQEIAMGLV
jgi:hypothetical protein